MDDLSPILAGLLGSLGAGLATGVGALPVLVRATWSKASQHLMLAVAAGVMLSATMFSLLQPALDLQRSQGVGSVVAVATVGGGVMLGALVLWGLDVWVPHEHFTKGREGSTRIHLSRHWLFVIAIALHNIPEGLSVGVAYGAGAVATGFGVTLGIALQNLPEGLAVAAALVSDGMRRGRAFLIALLTGLVEPLGGLAGALAVNASADLLPWGLGFAAGAMIYVVSGEVLPETHREGGGRLATLAVVVGFVVMMVLARVIG